jgi:hypothetical protein
MSQQKSPMSEQNSPKLKSLELNKETVQELTEIEAEQVKGGFIMQDTVIVPTGRRVG